jgi:hypothetical protein
MVPVPTGMGERPPYNACLNHEKEASSGHVERLRFADASITQQPACSLIGVHSVEVEERHVRAHDHVCHEQQTLLSEDAAVRAPTEGQGYHRAFSDKYMYTRVDKETVPRTAVAESQVCSADVMMSTPSFLCGFACIVRTRFVDETPSKVAKIHVHVNFARYAYINAHGKRCHRRT